MDNKRLRKIEVEYRNSWILAIILFFLSILFPIVTFIITCELKQNTSVFLAFPLVHLWWFAPARAGYLPFFIRKLIYHPSLMKRLFWLTFFWPFLIFILLLVDCASNLWVTKALFTSIFFLSGALPSIIASMATMLPLLARELPEWVVVESRSSQILYIPWQKVMNASKRAEEMTQKVRKRLRFHVGIYDPFLNRKFWSKEINHQSLLQEFSYLEWVKKHPEWGRK